MGALPKPYPEPVIVDVDEIDGQQVIRLPARYHVDANKLEISQSGSGFSLRPVPRPPTEEEFDKWVADMQAFQAELGDLFPEGRNQPQMPEPRDIFPEDSFENDQR